ncbi:DUF4214 domain-containing protein [Propionivibrio limicola]|uniref:DUF4214 domain-containing protein n=1 Tax=Propionivibrio limicola TaxID=167645 RepID=UPI0012911BEE|nr:DUF4214 domain-containing protein [Propionivibrio limicola]
MYLYETAASFEPNSTVELAQEITTGSYSINGQGDDWYSIEATPGSLEFVMTPATGTDVNMVLYNSQMQIVAANYSAGTETISYITSQSETLYLKIFPTAASTSNYNLSVTLPENTWSTQLDFGPIRDVSVALYDIDKDGKEEIFVGTSKALDSQLNETRPAGLICLEDDGTIKWSVSFPAISGPDSQTGKTYTTTSVSTAPSFSDLDGDGSTDIVIGVGADTTGEAGASVVGQPGDKGGIYALDANGNIKWFHQSLDVIGGSTNTGDGRPDGVYGSPVVFDIDRDGVKEVIYNSWDQNTWILDGRTGAEEQRIHLADTVWSTPRIADLNGDNIFEILVSADITANADARTSTGGIFHVISADGSQNFPGFNQPVGNPSYTELRGKYEEQALWSSPVTADIDGDGKLEIIYGTGNFFHDGRGSYIKVWEDDGSLKYTLRTHGQTFATPLVADLDNDGSLEIIAATLDGYIHAWDRYGQEIFNTPSRTFYNTAHNPIFSAPIAVDLDGDAKLEILYSQGAQMVILDHAGTQISSSTEMEYIFQFFKGSPAAKDVDNDGHIDIISGGTTSSKDQSVVYCWASPSEAVVNDFTVGRYQFNQSTSNISDFVTRFYETILGRTPDPHGLNDWTDRLNTGISSGSEVAQGFIFSQEFTNQAVNNDEYVDILYRAFFNRQADNTGKQYWLDKIASGANRGEVLDGFIYSQEFRNLASAYSILPTK